MNNNNKKKNYFFFFYISELFTHFRRHSNENSARKGKKKKESDIRAKLFCLVLLAVVFAEQRGIRRRNGREGREGEGEKRGCCVHPEATA